MRRSGFCLVVILTFLFSVELYAQCGVERWSVKTGTDADKNLVNLSSTTSTTIYNMLQSVHPSSLPANNRVAPREVTQYSVNGTLTTYKRETDSDYHLVIKDGSGRTMIVEIPSVNCLGTGSRFSSGVSNARAQFDARLTATTSFKTTSIPVTIRGVGFWDFLHGQTGVAPNGIEIHPVLNITFNSAKNGEEDVTVPEEPLPADMVYDDDGGRVHVYRGGEALGNILHHGGVVIESPRLHVVFVGDHWSDADRQSALKIVHSISDDSLFREVMRYGTNTPFTVDGDRALGVRRDARAFGGANEIASAQRELNDLDVQRLLDGAIRDGKLQQIDENAIQIVLMDRETSSIVGTSKDWVSYHSLFHPTDLAMPYVVVRGGLQGDALRDAIYASVARTVVNPQGNGWY